MARVYENEYVIVNADPFFKPKPQPSATFFADRLQVFLHPSIDAFEKEMLADLERDRVQRDGFNDPTPIQISERRLRVRAPLSPLCPSPLSCLRSCESRTYE